MRLKLTVLALLALSSGTQAQPTEKTPEQMLPADALFYFRYDGYEGHRKAYDQTAVAKAMKEGLSEFFEHVFAQIWTLGQTNPLVDNSKKKSAPALEVNQFLDCLWKHGFALSLEIAPPRPGPTNGPTLFQLTVLFPHGAEKTNRAALDAVFRLAAGALAAPVEDAQYKGRTLAIVALGIHQAAWWTEGKHLVFALGPRAAMHAVRVIDGLRSNLTAAPWYPELAQFNRYETDMRGYVNLETLVERLASLGLDEPAFGNVKDHIARQLLLRHLGLHGLKNLTFHLGFDGKYQRSTVRLGVPEPAQRGGLLKLVGGTIDFTPDRLPALPPDADYVSARRVDWSNVFDFIRNTYGMSAVSQLFTGRLPERFPDLDRLIGCDFRKDFLEQLDTTLVSYGAHSEGPFFLGQGFAVRLKDADKVRMAVAGVAKALGELGPQLVAEKRMFHGEEVYVLSNFYLPLTYAVHKDWLVFALFPQPVQGFVMRSGGKYRAWQTPPELHDVLAKARQENPRGKLLAVTVSDPRPAMTLGLALLPAFIQYFNVLAGTSVLDVSKIPNVQSINEWLFPNVSLFFDDGQALRWENHYSITEPDHLLLGLMFSTFGAGFLDIGPTRFQVELAKAEPLVVPVPEESKQPSLCPATATENDGVVQIRLTVRRVEVETVMRPFVETRFKEVVSLSGKKQVPYTVREMKPETISRYFDEQKLLTADGKTVRVAHKGGKMVDPIDLPKLLDKETQVLLVPPNCKTGAEQLNRLDDRTLIITVASWPAEPLPPARKK